MLLFLNMFSVDLTYRSHEDHLSGSSSQELYPYVHIVTWSLPKRYLGLLRIFNLPLEDYPHQFITQNSENFSSYEPHVTKKSISSLQPEISSEELAKPRIYRKEEPTQEAELAQASSGNSSPPKGRGRRPKKKPVISIKVKLDDDLKNLQRTSGKNFDKILSKCSKRSCLLVIEKSKSTRSDEYSLNFISNTSYSKPFSKLVRKNRRKTNSSVLGSIPKEFNKPDQSLSSEFCEENIHPSLKMISKNISETKLSFNPQSNEKAPKYNQESDTKINISETTKVEKDIKLNSKQKTNLNNEEIKANIAADNQNTQLVIPSHLVPYKESVQKEKPLRHWPVITQLFDKDHIEIYKNYLNTLSTQNEEEKDEESQENNTNGDENIAIDISDAKAFHEKLKSNSIKGNQENESYKTETVTTKESREEFRSFQSSDSPFRNDNYLEKSDEDKKLNTHFSTEKRSDSTNYFVMSENADIGSQKLYTSTAYLSLSGAKEDTKKKFNSERNESASKSLVTMKLLSSSMKTYESITKDVDEKTFHDCEEGFDTENVNEDSSEKNRRNSERKISGLRKLYLFNIVLAIFVTVVLGIILFISFADTSTVNKVVDKYIKR